MSNLGLPVPPGFTITTEVCTWYYDNGKQFPPDLEAQAQAALAEMGRLTGKPSATPPIRFWCRFARAPAPRCRA